MKKKSFIAEINIWILAFTIILIISLTVVFITSNIAGKTIAFVLVLLSMLLIIFYICVILRPIKRIKKKISNVNNGEKIEILLGEKVFVSEEYELYENILEKLKKKNGLLIDNTRMELILLQNQINPHFLYNTLESIRSDALCADLYSLADTVRSLANFFRYTISESKDVYPVAAEVDNIKNYFAIQKYRFGEKLELVINFKGDSEKINSYMMPKLTLQPLVENAIIHGLDPMKAKGMLVITFSCTEKKLLIDIKDNGVGMNSKKVHELNNSLKNVNIKNRLGTGIKHGIALKNINSRIKIMFGNEYGIHIFSTLKIGTDVKVTLPIVGGEM